MKNEFDDILKKRWEEINFPVDDNHRKDMIRLLDQTKRRKGGFLWWFGGIVLIAAIGSMLFYTNPDDKILSLTDPDKADARSEMINGRAIVTEPVIDQTGNSHSDKTSGNRSDENLPILNKQNSNTSDAPVKKTQNPSEAKAKNDSGEKNKLVLKSNSLHSNTKKDLQLNEITAVSPISEMGNQDHPTEAFENENEINNSNLNPPLENNTGPVELPQDRNSVITEQLAFPIISDLDFSREILAWPIEPAFRKKHPVNLFAEAGIGYIPPSLPDVKSGWSIKTGGGFGYTLFPKTQLIWSAGYMLQKDGFAFERTSTVNQPDFGARSSFHTLTPDKLHFVYSRFGVQQHFRRHNLSAAVGAQWLYGAQGTVVIQTYEQLAQIPKVDSRYTWLKLDGMNRLLWNGEISYGYQLTPRLSLQLGLKYYFTSLEAVDADLAKEGFYWKGKFAPFNPSFTINYRFYGK